MFKMILSIIIMKKLTKYMKKMNTIKMIVKNNLYFYFLSINNDLKQLTCQNKKLSLEESEFKNV